MNRGIDAKAGLSKLEKYCKNQQAFYSLAIQKTAEFEAVASELHNISVRWVEICGGHLTVEDTALFCRLLGELREISTTIKMTNSFLCKKAEECFSNVEDLHGFSRLHSVLLDWTLASIRSDHVVKNFLSVSSVIECSLPVFLTLSDGVVAGEERRSLMAAIAAISESANQAKETINIAQPIRVRWKKLYEQFQNIINN